MPKGNLIWVTQSKAALPMGTCPACSWVLRAPRWKTLCACTLGLHCQKILCWEELLSDPKVASGWAALDHGGATCGNAAPRGDMSWAFAQGWTMDSWSRGEPRFLPAVATANLGQEENVPALEALSDRKHVSCHHSRVACDLDIIATVRCEAPCLTWPAPPALPLKSNQHVKKILLWRQKYNILLPVQISTRCASKKRTSPTAVRHSNIPKEATKANSIKYFRKFICCILQLLVYSVQILLSLKGFS